ncbi:hypothetical protein FG379_001363 [Cryptosporidium bovis]|uniref:uncharacterized protein n=1 Tax=Cryptosporidium bovis TaxID=310047 RepID=UPI00351A03AB|nr:hypothetical protein FG379_001363 [Cryptosporidium bovis]
MKDLQIFSGNCSSIVGSYFGKNFIENHEFKDREIEINFSESKNDCVSNINSVAVFDSNFEDFRLDLENLDGKLVDSCNSNSLFTSMVKNNFDDTFRETIKEDVYMKSIWGGNIEVFEQFDSNNKYSTKMARFHLKNIFGEKNIKSLKIKNSSFEKNTRKRILSNCYNTLNLSDTRINDQIEDVIENLRHELESLDLIKAFYFILDADSVYGDVSKTIMDYLQDEAPSSRKPSIMLLSINSDSIFSDILNFSVAKCLVDHNESSGDIWLMNMLGMKDIIHNSNFVSSINPYSLSAIALDQIIKISNTSYNSYNVPFDIFNDYVNHPFRNIASLIYKNEIDKFKTQISGNSIECVCKDYFIDFCQTGFHDLNSLNKHSILSFTSGKKDVLKSKQTNSTIFWKEL